MPSLFDPLQLGDLTLKNRVIMAPLTRMRSQQPGDIPHTLNARYYAQRASAGLIISEATQISPLGKGYPATPGIYSNEQIAGWKLVTNAVHEAKGMIFLQLWHVGRISHSSFHLEQGLPVAPSAIKPEGTTLTAEFKEVPFETPRALSTTEIADIVGEYAQAARNAMAAGFDGVEIHSANGYLLDQFLQDGSNHRTDQYGGSIENRARFLLEVVDTVAQVWGCQRMGVRLSPFGVFNDMRDSDPIKLFTYVLAKLSEARIAYSHVIEPRATLAGGMDRVNEQAPCTSDIFRNAFAGVFISAGGYTRETALHAVEEDLADAVAFGRIFIANPDLPVRLMQNAPLNQYNRASFYGGGEIGYTDYPFLVNT